jgi:integrase/recombinase XerD
MPVGPLFCVIDGRARGRPLTATSVRQQLRRAAVEAGVRRRFAPHQPRHAHAVEMAREGVPLNVIQRQLGHAGLGITSVYLQGIDNAEIIDTVHARRPPMISANAGLRLWGPLESSLPVWCASGRTDLRLHPRSAHRRRADRRLAPDVSVSTDTDALLIPAGAAPSREFGTFAGGRQSALGAAKRCRRRRCHCFMSSLPE